MYLGQFCKSPFTLLIIKLKPVYYFTAIDLNNSLKILIFALIFIMLKFDCVFNQVEDKTYSFSLEFIVRDYECDLQGVVNNAIYQHYLEHARHEFLISRGVSFVQLHEEGIDLIVTRVEIDYKYPLRSRDKFIVRLNIERSGNVRLLFLQDIYQDS